MTLWDRERFFSQGRGFPLKIRDDCPRCQHDWDASGKMGCHKSLLWCRKKIRRPPPPQEGLFTTRLVRTLQGMGGEYSFNYALLFLFLISSVMLFVVRKRLPKERNPDLSGTMECIHWLIIRSFKKIK